MLTISNTFTTTPPPPKPTHPPHTPHPLPHTHTHTRLIPRLLPSVLTFLRPLPCVLVSVSAGPVERASSQDEPGRCGVFFKKLISRRIKPWAPAGSPSKPASGSHTCSSASIWSPSNTLAAVICRRTSDNGHICDRL